MDNTNCGNEQFNFTHLYSIINNFGNEQNTF